MNPTPKLSVVPGPDRLTDAGPQRSVVSAPLGARPARSRHARRGRRAALFEAATPSTSQEPATPDTVTAALSDLEGVLAEAAVETLPDALGGLARLEALTNLRLFRSQGDQGPAEERLLGVKEAAARLDMPVSTLYKKAHALPFLKPMGRRLKFSDSGISAWIRKGTR